MSVSSRIGCGLVMLLLVAGNRWCSAADDDKATLRYRLPSMIGDFYGGVPLPIRGDAAFDRLFVFADELDVPAVLPPVGNPLMLTEPGPVGIFRTNLASVQQAQSIYRTGGGFPVAVPVGNIADNATLTTADTIAQIQAQLAGTPLAYDIILLQMPPATYDTAVDTVFQAANAVPGITVYNGLTSGALLQGGVDTLVGGEDLDAYYFYDYVVRFDASLANAASGGVGQLKISEGGGVLPQDRVYVRYSFLEDVGFSTPRDGLSRFTPGFEQSFADGLFSVEMRMPFAADAAAEVTSAGTSLTGSDPAWGNLMMYLKALLLDSESFALSGGLGLAFPTASDIGVNLTDGTRLLRIENDTVRIQPFLGGLYMPNERCFAQMFTQFDFATNENDVLFNAPMTGLQRVGSYGESSHFFFDLAFGYWAYRNDDSDRVTGVIPTLEIHQTSSLNGSEAVTYGNLQIGNYGSSTSITSAVFGLTVEVAKSTQLTYGYATPIGGGSDRQYDGAFRFQLTQRLP